MIAHLSGREKALEPFGWTGRRAEWIALVCLHSGVFTRAQWARFMDAHPEQVRRGIHALIAERVACEETEPGIAGMGRVCRIFARPVYRALGAEHIRHRRGASTEVLLRRLLSLDYVIEHSDLPWLPTKTKKVSAFEVLGIERSLLPVRVYRGAARSTRRHFPVKLPVALDSARALFVYADPGHDTSTALRSWGRAHCGLWCALRRLGRSVEVVAVARIERAILQGTVGPRPRGVRRPPGRAEAQRRAREAGATAGRVRIDRPQRRLADRAPREGPLPMSGGRAVPHRGVKTTRGVVSRIGPQAIHAGLSVHPLTRWRLAASRPGRPLPDGPHRPWRERPGSPRACCGLGARCVCAPLSPPHRVAPRQQSLAGRPVRHRPEAVDHALAGRSSVGLARIVVRCRGHDGCVAASRP